MKANELRIGNLIGCDIQTLIVKAVNDETVICHTMGGKPYTLYFEDVYGLKLTEEWLLKFGFEKIDKEFQVTYAINVEDECEEVFMPSKLYLGLYGQYCIGIPYESGGGKSKILYVHQLQNLYFALTGEELTLQQ